MYSSVFHINEEDGYNEEEGYFTEKNKDYTYVLTSIPKSPKIEQLYGTYSVRQGFSHELSREEKGKIEIKFKELLSDYLKKEKKRENQRYNAMLNILKTKNENKSKKNNNGENYMEEILKKYTFKS